MSFFVCRFLVDLPKERLFLCRFLVGSWNFPFFFAFFPLLMKTGMMLLLAFANGKQLRSLRNAKGPTQVRRLSPLHPLEADPVGGGQFAGKKYKKDTIDRKYRNVFSLYREEI